MTNNKFYKKRWFKFGVITLSLIICTIVSCVLYINEFKKGQVELVYSVARQLGYTAEDHLVEYRQCLASYCGLRVYFSTNLTRDELQILVDQVMPTKRRFGHLNGYSIFTDINQGSNKTLTADGNDGGINRARIKKPLAYSLRFLDKEGRSWRISFFNLMDQPHQYKIDNQPIYGNIVSVMLQTK